MSFYQTAPRTASRADRPRHPYPLTHRPRNLGGFVALVGPGVVMMGNNIAGQADPSRNPQFRRRRAELDALRHISGPADKMVKDMATKATKHWLTQAEASMGNERAICIVTATAIINMAGVDMADIQERRVA